MGTKTTAPKMTSIQRGISMSNSDVSPLLEEDCDASQKGLSAAERKKRQRERDKSQGWVEVTVKVSHEHAEKVREFAASLPAPRGPKKSKAPDAWDTIDWVLKFFEEQKKDAK